MARCLVLLCVFVAVALCDLPPYCGVLPPLVLPLPDAPGNANLTQVVAFIRHGDRTISSATTCWQNDTAFWNCSLTDTSYPNQDPSQLAAQVPRLYRKVYTNHREDYPGNCMTGQLTSKGYAQEFGNGEAFRKACIKGKEEFVNSVSEFMSEFMSYDPSVFFLRSDDEQRTTQSLMALMDGFYAEPFSGQTQLVNFFTMDDDIDTMTVNSKVCPAWDHLGVFQSGSEEYRSHTEKVTKPLLDKVSQLAGVSITRIGNIFDCAFDHLCAGQPMPTWLTDDLLNQINEEMIWEYQFSFSYPNTTFAGKVGIGPLLGDVQAVMADTSKKFILISGHDTTLFPLLVALGVFDGKWPHYASRFLIETWEGKEGPFVRMIYNDKVVGHMTTGELTAKLRDLVPTAADCNAKL